MSVDDRVMSDEFETEACIQQLAVIPCGRLTGASDTVHLPTDTAGWSQGDGGALIRGDYKVINTAPGGMGTTAWRLYDLAADPGERNDLAGQEPALTAELVSEWKTDWR